MIVPVSTGAGEVVTSVATGAVELKRVCALQQGGKATVRVDVVLTDAAGNSITVERSAKLKAKKPKKGR